MTEPQTIPADFRTQLRMFAEELQYIHKTVENEFYELEQKLLYYKNHFAPAESSPLPPPEQKANKE